jgi:hypothetical protein
MKAQHWLLLLLGNLLFLLIRPKPLLYHENEVLRNILPFILCFILQPLLLYKFLEIFKFNFNLRVMFTVVSVFVYIPCSIIETHRLMDELNNNGIKSVAIVTEKEYFNESKKRGWYIQYSFIINGKENKSEYIPDIQNTLSIGDTSTLLYLKDYPHIHLIQVNDSYFK